MKSLLAKLAGLTMLAAMFTILSCSNDSTVVKQEKTLQEAINELQPGDTLVLDESIIIDPDSTIEITVDNVTISGGNSSFNLKDVNVSITAKGVTLNNLSGIKSVQASSTVDKLVLSGDISITSLVTNGDAKVSVASSTITIEKAATKTADGKITAITIEKEAGFTGETPAVQQLTEAEVKALPTKEHTHTYGEWTEVKAATEEAEGSKERKCSVCGNKETEKIAKLAHTHKFAKEWSSDKTNHWHKATCDHKDEVDGKAVHEFEGLKCKVCGFDRSVQAGISVNAGANEYQGTVTITFDFDQMKYDPAIKDNFSELITITNNSNPAEVITPVMNRNNTKYEYTADFLSGEYTVTVPYFDGTKLTSRIFTVEAGKTSNITLSKTDIANAENYMLTNMGFVSSRCLTFRAKKAFTLKFNKPEGVTATLYTTSDLNNWPVNDYSAIEINATKIGNYYYAFAKGTGNTTLSKSNNTSTIIKITSAEASAEEFECYGNIMTLLDSQNPENVTMGASCFFCMFHSTNIITPPALPATALSDSCYYYMFTACKKLKSAPVLPATSLTDGCYTGMFSQCTNLKTPPVLPATNLPAGCYSSMFSACSSLKITDGSDNTIVNKVKFFECPATIGYMSTDMMFFFIPNISNNGTAEAGKTYYYYY